MHTDRERSKRWSTFVPALVLAVMTLVAVIGVTAALDIFRSRKTDDAPRPTVSVSSELLDFGVVPLNHSVARQVVLRNDGSEPLDVRLVTDAATFAVSPESMTLEPGESARVRVVARPAQAGDLRDELRVLFGDGDAGQFVIALKGHAEDQMRMALAERYNRSRSKSGEAGDEGRAAAADPTSTDGNSTLRSRSRAESGGSIETARTARSGSADGSPAAPAGTTGPTPLRRVVSRDPGSAEQASEGIDPSTDDRDDAALGLSRVAVIPPFSEPYTPPPTEISPVEEAEAKPLPEQVPDVEGLEELPEADPARDEEHSSDDDRDRDRERDDSPHGPLLTISGLSKVSLMGSSNTFYPQALPVLGTDFGGSLSLAAPIQFPLVPLAFGESVLLTQTGGASGVYDPASGQVEIQLSLAAIDSDGDSAPLSIALTTGSALGRNESGIVVSSSGSPRVPGSGLLKLVGIGQVPAGYNNGAERRLLMVEILATLKFDTEITPSTPFGSSRLAGSGL